MGAKTNLVMIFALITTILFVLSLTTPWWYTQFESASSNRFTRSLCWIDGTCRDGKWVYKDNGETQCVFDATLILMVVSLIPFLTFVHALLWRRSGRFDYYLSSRTLIIVSGVVTFALWLSAILVFAIQLVNRSDYDSLFGSEELSPSVSYPYKLEEWGATWGWFFAIASAIMLIPTIVLGATISFAQRKVYATLLGEEQAILGVAHIQKPSHHGRYTEDKSKSVSAHWVAPE